MNKYLRTKKFKANNKFNYHQHYCAMVNKKGPNKKEFRVYCIVILILLLCSIFYAICIHWNVFGIKDWYQRNEPMPTSHRSNNGKSLATEEPAAYIEHIVTQKQTLWGIAERYHPDKDIRETVWAIRVFNPGADGKRMSAKILPGQVVKVPLDVDAVEEGIKEIHHEEEEIELASRHEDTSRAEDEGK